MVKEKSEKIDAGSAGYVLGILSIVFGILSPVAGLVIGVIGFNISKKQSGGLALRAKKLNKMGVGVSIIVLALTVAATFYLNGSNLGIPGY
jgi:hypothetical protein